MVTPPLFSGSPRTAGTPAPRRPAARTTLSARLGRRGPQPRDVLRLALLSQLASDGGDPSPATSCGSHYSLSSPRTAGTPAPRRPAARTTLSARLGRRGPQPRDVLRLALP